MSCQGDREKTTNNQQPARGLTYGAQRSASHPSPHEGSPRIPTGHRGDVERARPRKSGGMPRKANLLFRTEIVPNDLLHRRFDTRPSQRAFGLKRSTLQSLNRQNPGALQIPKILQHPREIGTANGD